ncbi:MAG: methyltransferase domain-containing protein [Candidatus Methanoperedens sp.]|nr:methyltransferase domain-containing protein [Candidatus Methanoperedens sp.]
MNDLIELLDIGLLEDKELLKEIDHWLEVFNWPNGWHYDLDIIWITRQLENNNILPGATILDAGAGYGMTQFLLAARGYNVISLDFTHRDFPKKAKGIFDIEIIETDLGSFENEYMEYMTYGKSTNAYMHILKSVPKALLNPRKVIRNLNKKLKSYIEYHNEKTKNHNKFGEIKFLRGTFNNIPLNDKAVDALISISAFEHNKYDDMPGSINEFNRIIKDEGIMFITTSAARDKDWYQVASKGWNLTKITLSRWFNISNEKINFNYDLQYDGISKSKKLFERLDAYYKEKNNLTVPNGDLKNIEYIPVGIRKNKYYETNK